MGYNWSLKPLNFKKIREFHAKKTMSRADELLKRIVNARNLALKAEPGTQDANFAVECFSSAMKDAEAYLEGKEVKHDTR